MDLINGSLNRIDTIFSTRSLGSGEPDCPAGTFAAGYTMDVWERWRVVCLEDIYLFGTMITGVLLIGLGIALVYRENQKMVTAVQNLLRLPVMIDAVGRAVSTEAGTINRNLDNIMEKLAALENIMEKLTALDNIMEKLTALENIMEKLTALENIMEKLTALERKMDRFGDQNGLRK